MNENVIFFIINSYLDHKGRKEKNSTVCESCCPRRRQGLQSHRLNLFSSYLVIHTTFHHDNYENRNLTQFFNKTKNAHTFLMLFTSVTFGSLLETENIFGPLKRTENIFVLLAY